MLETPRRSSLPSRRSTRLSVLFTVLLPTLVFPSSRTLWRWRSLISPKSVSSRSRIAEAGGICCRSRRLLREMMLGDLNSPLSALHSICPYRTLHLLHSASGSALIHRRRQRLGTVRLCSSCRRPLDQVRLQEGIHCPYFLHVFPDRQQGNSPGLLQLFQGRCLFYCQAARR